MRYGKGINPVVHKIQGKTQEKSRKVALAACMLLDSLNAPHNICEIGKERIRRSGLKVKEENAITAPDLDIGFRVLKLDSTNMKDVYYTPEKTDSDELPGLVSNIKQDRTAEDLLFQVMLDLGILLSSPIEERTIAGRKVFAVDGNTLMGCFDQGVTAEVITELAHMKPFYFVMRDSSLADDSVAANFEQIFASISPDTVRRIL